MRRPLESDTFDHDRTFELARGMRSRSCRPADRRACRSRAPRRRACRPRPRARPTRHGPSASGPQWRGVDRRGARLACHQRAGCPCRARRSRTEVTADLTRVDEPGTRVRSPVGALSSRRPRPRPRPRPRARRAAAQHDRRDDERRDRERRGERERGAVAVDQRGGVGGAARAVGRDGRQDRDAERAADLLGRVDEARREAGVLGRDAGHRERHQRGDDEAGADAHQQQRGKDVDEVAAVDRARGRAARGRRRSAPAPGSSTARAPKRVISRAGEPERHHADRQARSGGTRRRWPARRTRARAAGTARRGRTCRACPATASIWDRFAPTTSRERSSPRRSSGRAAVAWRDDERRRAARRRRAPSAQEWASTIV